MISQLHHLLFNKKILKNIFYQITLIILRKDSHII